ncbi:MAG: exported protein of unknown function [Candidatus Kaiserbacteria bacterium]|nr:exported protein of unknown function [Candidatus Kaiserbacteria bacterium]
MNSKNVLKGSIISAVVMTAVFAFAGIASASTSTADFESFSAGSVNGQQNWTSGSNDQAIVDSSTYGFAAASPLGSGVRGIALRVSNEFGTGGFGDQIFAAPISDSVGETSATAAAFAVGTKTNHFEAQFDIASTLPTVQSGLTLSVSPDRGDGSRMSYLRFEDQADGIHVIFSDVTDAGPLPTVATFNMNDIATIDRGTHTIKMTLDTVDGASNDVVQVFIDGVLKKTGTSWENYYRYDAEASAEQSPRIVKTLIIRSNSATGVTGNGFLFDNFSISNSTTVAPATVYVNGSYSSTIGASTTDGHTVGVDAFTTLEAAVKAVAANGTVKVYPGNYNLVKDDTTVLEGQTGWYLALTKNGVTLQGVDAAGTPITDAANVAANIYSTQPTANGAWATQNLITVFADNVTIKGLRVMNKLSPNKGIEVLGNNFTAQYNEFAPIPVSILPSAANYSDPDGSTGNDISKYGSGVYFNNNSATAARTGTVTNNLFTNSGVTFDSFGSNWTVAVNNNTFTGNKIWSDATGATYYSAIGATTWVNQPDFTGSTVDMHQNKFLSMATDQVILKIKSGMTGTFKADDNYWGNTTGPTAANISGSVINVSPWYSDAAMTGLGFTTTSPSPSSTTATTGSSNTDSSTTSNGTTVTADVPANTTVTGSNTWDGTIEPVTVVTTQGVPPSSNSTQTSTVLSIEVGSPTSQLTLSNAAKLTFVGQAGKLIAWSFNGLTTPITTSCSSIGVTDQATANANLAAGADCKADVAGDLVVWTKHFTVFSVYTETAASVSSGGGGGGGGGNGPVAGSTGTAPLTGATTGTTGGTTGTVSTGNGGQVLGASTYNFTTNLTIGSKGADVNALQQILIDAGYLKISSTTGFYGSLTASAVKMWQKAHGISQTGTVGPLTRAALNAGTTTTMTDAQRTALVASLTAQLTTLQAQLAALIAAKAATH